MAASISARAASSAGTAHDSTPYVARSSGAIACRGSSSRYARIVGSSLHHRRNSGAPHLHGGAEEIVVALRVRLRGDPIGAPDVRAVTPHQHRVRPRIRADGPFQRLGPVAFA